MSSIVVGLFDAQADAAAAQSKLLAAGFAASALSLTGGSPDSSTASTAAAPQHEGAIARFFDNLFGSDDDIDEADRAGHTSTYTEAFRRGSFGLTVRAGTDAELDKAEAILNAAGAVDVDERSEEWRKEGWTDGAAADATMTSGDGTQKLQEVREELQVGKRAVVRGGVRVFTRMTETPVEESITLREERADIRRTAVDRPVTAGDLSAFREGSIEVRETGEEAVVSKTARVTGEVEVGKSATERQETVKDTVRETRVEVEKLATGDVSAERKSY